MDTTAPTRARNGVPHLAFQGSFAPPVLEGGPHGHPAHPARTQQGVPPLAAVQPTPMARLSKHVLNRLLNILFSYPTDTWEFASSLLLMAWGAWVLVFPETMDFESTVALVKSVSVLPLAPNVAVGLLTLVPGLAGFGSLFYRRFDQFRIWAVAFEAATFTTMAYGIALAEPRHWSIPLFALFSLFTVLSVLRLVLSRRDVMEALGHVPASGRPSIRSAQRPAA